MRDASSSIPASGSGLVSITSWGPSKGRVRYPRAAPNADAIPPRPSVHEDDVVDGLGTGIGCFPRDQSRVTVSDQHDLLVARYGVECGGDDGGVVVQAVVADRADIRGNSVRPGGAQQPDDPLPGPGAVPGAVDENERGHCEPPPGRCPVPEPSA